MKKIKITKTFTEEELASLADSLSAAGIYFDRLIDEGWGRTDLKTKSNLCHDLCYAIHQKLGEVQ